MNRILLITIVALVSIAGVAAQSVKTLSPAIDPTKNENLCWLDDDTKVQTCVPMSIVKATFNGYQTDQPSPVNAMRQALIANQSQLSQTLANYRTCEGQLAPLQADQHQKALQQAQQQLDVDNQKAAPEGQMWDTKTQKYTSVPADKPRAGDKK